MRGIAGTWWAKTALVCVLLALGGIASVLRGQDANWDLLNYHIRDPYTILHGRLGIDLDPAALQSYFNPTLDLPYYALSMGPLARHPRLLAAAMGLPFGALALGALCLSYRMFSLLGPVARPVVTLLAAGAAVTGAASLTQLGTTFNEVPVAALTVFGLLAALPKAGHPVASVSLHRMVLAGLLFGAAAGLKLTALVYAPAIGITLFFFMPFRRWLRVASVFSAGWAASFLAFAGWWSVLLYRHFQSPLFPLFNALFQSPWYPPTNWLDQRFFPRSPAQWAFYPFYWLFDAANLNSELPYRDPRLALFLVAAGCLLGWMGWRRVFRHTRPSRAPTTVQQDMTLVFAVVAYVLWLCSAAIMRYGIVLEITGTLTTVALLVRLAGLLGPRVGATLQVCAVTAVTACYGAWTLPSDFGHIPYGSRVFSVDMSWTAKDTLFIAVTGPTAYVTAFVPEDRAARTVGFSYLNPIAADWPLTGRSKAMVRDHRGPIEILVPPDDSSMLPYLPLIGLAPRLGACRQITSNLDSNGVKACEGTKLPDLG